MADDKDRAETAPRSHAANGKGRYRFPKGTSGNPKGRPKGRRNHATADVKDFCSQLVDDPEYRHALRNRLLAGTAGTIESLVWHYAKGKPIERTEQGGPGAFTDVSTDELRRRLAAALGKL